jgi:hypothetical protein
VTAACEFSIWSTLLDQHGIALATGCVTALIANGLIESVHLDRGHRSTYGKALSHCLPWMTGSREHSTRMRRQNT